MRRRSRQHGNAGQPQRGDDHVDNDTPADVPIARDAAGSGLTRATIAELLSVSLGYPDEAIPPLLER